MTFGGELFRPQEGVGEHGAKVPGPPWILGRRGAPREAPENTLASLRRAVDLGLDGFAYELRACFSGELVLLADELLDRTTDLMGPLATKTMPELAAADAGSWFGKRYSGEPLTLFEETFGLPGNAAGTWPQHLIELAEPGLVDDVARALSGGGERLSVRLASTRSSVCASARAAGLQALWIVPEATEHVRQLARDEGVAAVGARSGWRPKETWSCERWALDVDDPEALLAAVQLPVNGLTTTEPRRATAVRALCFLAGAPLERYPVRAPVLPMEAGSMLHADGTHPFSGAGSGEWAGRWDIEVGVENPFPFQVRVALELVVRRGAFEAEGLPAAARLMPREPSGDGGVARPGQAVRFRLRLVGGSWRLGGDPLVVAHYSWDEGPGRPAGALSLDATLERRRTLELGESARRVELVRERPGDPPATMTVRRRGRDLIAAIEDPGDLADARTLVHLDGSVHTGGQGLRLRLPEDFHLREGGLPFSVGITGLRPLHGPNAGKAGNALGRGRSAPRGGAVDDSPGDRERAVRRWAGGLPDTLDGGAPGRLLAGDH